jgi:hypothetical protein
MLSVTLPSIAFSYCYKCHNAVRRIFLLLCFMSLCWVLHFLTVMLSRVSLCWVSRYPFWRFWRIWWNFIVEYTKSKTDFSTEPFIGGYFKEYFIILLLNLPWNNFTLIYHQIDIFSYFFANVLGVVVQLYLAKQ